MRLEKVNEAHVRGVQVVTAKELADMLELSTTRLAHHRWRKTGPKFSKRGKCVVYLIADVMAWLTKGETFASTTEASAHRAGLLGTKKSSPNGRRSSTDA